MFAVQTCTPTGNVFFLVTGISIVAILCTQHLQPFYVLVTQMAVDIYKPSSVGIVDAHVLIPKWPPLQ